MIAMKTTTMLTDRDDCLDKFHTSTRLKRTKRVVDRVYLYLFGFNFDAPYARFHWKAGILQDLNRIKWNVKHWFLIRILDLIILYCKFRNDKIRKKWESSVLNHLLKWMKGL